MLDTQGSQQQYGSHVLLLGKAKRGRAAWSCASNVSPISWQERAQVGSTSGWIYAIYEDETPLVKIGYTQLGTLERLKTLAYDNQQGMTLVGSVFVSHDVGKIERCVHRFLSQQRIEGEWFYLHINQAILEKITGQALAFLRSARNY